MTVPEENTWLWGNYGFELDVCLWRRFVTCCGSELSLRNVLHSQPWLCVCRVNSCYLESLLLS